jgi:hypothetical protein
MHQDPTNFKEGTMAFLNTAFPGMYGGTIETAAIEGAQFEDYVSKINPMQVFYVNQKIIDTSGKQDTKVKGYVLTGSEIIAVWKNKYGKAQELNPSTSYVTNETVNGSEDTTKSDPDPFSDANKKKMDAANAAIERATRLLELAKKTGETGEVLENLSEQITAAKVNAGEVAEEIQQDETDVAFKERQQGRKNAPSVFKGNQYSANGNQEDLELAIEQRDKSKIQKVIDNIDKLMKDNPASVKVQQMISAGIPVPGNKNYNLSNTKAEAQAALNNMGELLEQDIVKGKNDIKSVEFDELQSKFDSAMESDPTRDELIEIISQFNDAIKLGKETKGVNSQMRVQMLENMKLSLLRGIR